MRPYNTYRNPELSQPVSSVENTLTDKTLNASFDLLRSLSESISVDCGSFEISSPTEYYQNSSAPSHVAFVDPRGKEIRTPVESAPETPVKSEPSVNREAPKMTQPSDRDGSQVEDGSSADSSFGNKTLSACPRGFASEKSFVNPASDMDDDDYDCMNDPNYFTQRVKETDSPSFEELMARTAEGLAKMREEAREVYSTSEKDELQEKCRVAETSNSSRPQPKTEAPKPETKPAVDSHSESSARKRFLSSISWDKTKKLLFNRETIKLTLLSIAVSALIVSAVIYRNSSRRNNGLSESEDVVMNQTASEIQEASAQGNVVSSDNGEFKDSANANYWGTQDNNTWASSDDTNPRGLTDQMRGDYQSPTFDSDSSGFEYGQNDSKDLSNPEDAGRQLAPPHSSNNNAQFVDTIPAYNPGPKYAEVSPAFGAQYSQDEYESPILEDDSVSEYSETGYNSNFMR